MTASKKKAEQKDKAELKFNLENPIFFDNVAAPTLTEKQRNLLRWDIWGDLHGWTMTEILKYAKVNRVTHWRLNNHNREYINLKHSFAKSLIRGKAIKMTVKFLELAEAGSERLLIRALESDNILSAEKLVVIPSALTDLPEEEGEDAKTTVESLAKLVLTPSRKGTPNKKSASRSRRRTSSNSSK